MKRSEVRRGGGGTFFLLLFLAAFASLVWQRVQAKRDPRIGPRVPPARFVSPLLDASDSLSPGFRKQLRWKLRQFHRETGVKFRVRVLAPVRQPPLPKDLLEPDPEGDASLGLVIFPKPAHFELYHDASFADLLDSSFQNTLEEQVSTRFSKRFQLEGFVRFCSEQVMSRVRRSLRQGLRYPYERSSRWPRRWWGKTAEQWHQVSQRGLAAITVLFVLFCMGFQKHRQALYSKESDFLGPGQYFSGASEAGGFGGGVRGGRHPPIGW